MPKFLKISILAFTFVVLNVAFVNCSIHKSDTQSSSSGGLNYNGGAYQGKFVRYTATPICGPASSSPEGILEWINGAFKLTVPMCGAPSTSSIVQPVMTSYDPYYLRYEDQLFYESQLFAGSTAKRISLKVLCTNPDFQFGTIRGVDLAIRNEAFSSQNVHEPGQLVLGYQDGSSRLIEGSGYFRDPDPNHTRYFGPNASGGRQSVDWNDERSFEAYIYNVLDGRVAFRTTGKVILYPGGVEVPVECHVDYR